MASSVQRACAWHPLHRFAGLTLVEVLIVLAILAVLTAVLGVSPLPL